MAEEAPPPYSTDASPSASVSSARHSSPPSPRLPPPPPQGSAVPSSLLNPSHFNVNGHWHSFVSTYQLEAHLCLLRGFKELKERVEREADLSWPCFSETLPAAVGTEESVGNGKGKQKLAFTPPGAREGVKMVVEDDNVSPAWRVFVAMAVRRFERWIVVLDTKPEWKNNPRLKVPLDVLMVWHAYALEPLIYREDCTRPGAALENVDGFPYEEYTRVVGPIGYLKFEMTTWLHVTGMYFDPLEAMAKTPTRPVLDPWTGENVAVAWWKKDGTGFSQDEFCHTSSSSGAGLITHERLGVQRLVEALAVCSKDSNRYLVGPGRLPYSTARSISRPLAQNETEDCLSGEGLGKLITSYIFHRKVGTGKSRVALSSEKAIGDCIGWSLQGARDVIKAELQSSLSGVFVTRKKTEQWAQLDALRNESADLIVNSFRRGEAASMDLQAAVLSQSTFISRVDQLGWLSENNVAANSPLLCTGRARYHAYVDLLTQCWSNDSLTTLDIDLALNTHKLASTKYYTTVPSDVGWFPAFNPSRSPPPLDKMAGGIAKQWEARFGIPYTLPAGALTRSELESAIDQLRVQAGESKRWSYSIAALLPPAFVTNGTPQQAVAGERWEDIVTWSPIAHTGYRDCAGRADGRKRRNEPSSSPFASSSKADDGEEPSGSSSLPVADLPPPAYTGGPEAVHREQKRPL